ncbi:MAG: hypothetical protein AAF702_14825 [Chloroflexota bacterium]
MTTQKMPSLPVRIVVSILALALPLIIAAVALGGIVQPTYFPELTPETEAIGLLFGGMAVMGILIALFYPYLRIETGPDWFMNALPVAVLAGLIIFFATHMIQAGYIQISATGWLLEGLYDSVAPMVSIMALAWLTNRQNKNQELDHAATK